MFKQTQKLLAGYRLNEAGETVWSIHTTVHKKYKLITNSTKYFKGKNRKGTGSSGIGYVASNTGEYSIIRDKVRTYPKPQSYDKTLRPLVSGNVPELYEKWDTTKYPKGHLSGSYFNNLVLQKIENPKEQIKVELTTITEGVHAGRKIYEKK